MRNDIFQSRLGERAMIYEAGPFRLDLAGRIDGERGRQKKKKMDDVKE